MVIDYTGNGAIVALCPKTHGKTSMTLLDATQMNLSVHISNVIFHHFPIAIHLQFCYNVTIT